MNTPNPCDRCNHCAWSCMTEDDPNESAYCTMKLPMGRANCHEFSPWSQAKRRLITYAIPLLKEKK